MGFHEKFGDILRRRLKSDRRHTSAHRSPHGRLRNSGLYSEFPVPVWPLGALNEFLLSSISRSFLNRSERFFHRMVDLAGDYRFPHRIRELHFRFGGQTPDRNRKMTFLFLLVNFFLNSVVGKFLHECPEQSPLTD